MHTIYMSDTISAAIFQKHKTGFELSFTSHIFQTHDDYEQLINFFREIKHLENKINKPFP